MHTGLFGGGGAEMGLGSSSVYLFKWDKKVLSFSIYKGALFPNPQVSIKAPRFLSMYLPVEVNS